MTDDLMQVHQINDLVKRAGKWLFIGAGDYRMPALPQTPPPVCVS